jgi:uridylate kinase
MGLMQGMYRHYQYMLLQKHIVVDVVCTTLKKGVLLFFLAERGIPFFTTDTCAVLRATEMECDLLLKATKVDGVYSSDPLKDSSAKYYDFLTYDDILKQQLGVMDATAITLAAENKLPIAIFSIYEDNNFAKVLSHDTKFTLIK